MRLSGPPAVLGPLVRPSIVTPPGLSKGVIVPSGATRPSFVPSETQTLPSKPVATRPGVAAPGVGNVPSSLGSADAPAGRSRSRARSEAGMTERMDMAQSWRAQPAARTTPGGELGA